jgi:hypothetical protein
MRDKKQHWESQRLSMESRFRPTDRFWRWGKTRLGNKMACLLMHFLLGELDGWMEITRSSTGFAGTIQSVRVPMGELHRLQRTAFPLGALLRNTGIRETFTPKGELVYKCSRKK